MATYCHLPKHVCANSTSWSWPTAILSIAIRLIVCVSRTFIFDLARLSFSHFHAIICIQLLDVIVMPPKPKPKTWAALFAPENETTKDETPARVICQKEKWRRITPSTHESPESKEVQDNDQCNSKGEDELREPQSHDKLAGSG